MVDRTLTRVNGAEQRPRTRQTDGLDRRSGTMRTEGSTVARTREGGPVGMTRAGIPAAQVPRIRDFNPKSRNNRPTAAEPAGNGTLAAEADGGGAPVAAEAASVA